MTKLNAGKASVFALAGTLLVAAFLLGKSLVTSNSVYAGAGTAGLGDQCDINSEDSSHVCEDGLICVSDNPGNGKCEYESTGTATATATATGTATATATSTAVATGTAEPTIDPCIERQCETASPTPTEEPTSTPLSCSGDTHPDAAGKNCVTYSLGGPGAPSGGTGGQVLGATTMAKTGSFLENLYMAIMGLGGLVTFKGLKNFKKAFKKA